MKFCKTCKNYLDLVERIVDGERNLYNYCKNCKVYEISTSLQIITNNYKKNITFDRSHLNKYIKSSNINKYKRSRCPHCKKSQMNAQEISYENSLFVIKNVCSKCNKDY